MKNNILQKNIPEGWNKCLLKDVISNLRNGCSSQQITQKTIFPVTRIETISDGFINYNKIGYVKDIDPSYKLQKGDILLSNINSLKHIGKIAYFDNERILYHGMNLLLLRFNDLLDKKFGYYLLISKKKWFEDNASKAINQASINQTTLNKLPLIIPSNIKEQRKIGNILSKVGEEINKIDELISKNEKIKNGLMNNLFTKGIGHKKYKKTKLGEIPEDWETKKLGEIAFITRGGSPRPIESYITEDENGLNWLKIGDIETGAKYIYKTTQKIKKSGLSKTTLVKVDDFILSNSMSFGRPYIMKIDACIHDGWLAFKDINTNLIIKDYLYYLLSSKNMQDIFRSISAGSGVKNLKRESVANLFINLPKINEQEKISEILSSVDKKLGKQKELKEKLTQLKKGLMSDLLSGKVRVNI